MKTFKVDTDRYNAIEIEIDIIDKIAEYVGYDYKPVDQFRAYLNDELVEDGDILIIDKNNDIKLFKGFQWVWFGIRE